MMLLLGRLPSNTFDFTSASDAFAPSSCTHRQLWPPASTMDREDTHLADLLLGLAECERLGLREEVGEEDAVVERVADRVVRRRGRDEVGRDELRALMHELVERVLPVRARRAPDDRLRAVRVSIRGVSVKGGDARRSGSRRAGRPW